MLTSKTCAEWNEVAFLVMQSLLGLISPNFRRICLIFENSTWVVDFILENDNSTDRSEIADYLCAMDAKDWNEERWKFNISVKSGLLDYPLGENIRVIYWRRE